VGLSRRLVSSAVDGFDEPRIAARVESRHSVSVPRTAAYGATWPFATGPAKVGNPYPQQPFYVYGRKFGFGSI